MRPRPNRDTERIRESRPKMAAREVVYHVLTEYQRSGAFVADTLAREADKASLSSEDRRLAMELVSGIVRRESTLDALIAPCTTRLRQNIEENLWTLLRIGAYQLVFTSSIPEYAAINETVEVPRRLGKGGWTGFLNGVLRSVGRSLTEESVDQPGPACVPLADGRYRKLAEDRFADPVEEPAKYIAQAFSFPQWLVDRWSKRYSFEELCALGFWFNSPPTLTLRANSLRTTRDELLAKLKDAGVEASAGHHALSVALKQSARIDRLPGFEEGLFVVQDETAMQAAELLAPEPGQSTLDLCAAPGTKTTHLAELMRNEGTILAVDVDPDRLSRIHENAQRLGITMIKGKMAETDGSDLPKELFDAILIDVPCSNTGVLAKRPEARWRLTPNDLVELAELQSTLLWAALERLKPGGRLVYSTCSIEPEENAQLLRSVITDEPWRDELKLVEEREYRPGQPADGGYQALLIRRR
ncbi:MAG: 16S rRNA (cytosine(967)-C(5))-methyltransferase RsmB [Planctomycetaceae bacterium]